jgi:hypothetical protein
MGGANVSFITSNPPTPVPLFVWCFPPLPAFFARSLSTTKLLKLEGRARKRPSGGSSHLHRGKRLSLCPSVSMSVCLSFLSVCLSVCLSVSMPPATAVRPANGVHLAGRPGTGSGRASRRSRLGSAARHCRRRAASTVAGRRPAAESAGRGGGRGGGGGARRSGGGRDGHGECGAQRGKERLV